MSAPGPKFVRYMGPVLKALHGLGGSGRPAEVGQRVAELLSLPNEVLDAQYQSGVSRFEKEVAFARFYLVKEGFIDSSERGVWVLTDKGLATQELSHSEALEIFRRINPSFKGKAAAETSGLEENEGEPEPASWRSALLARVRELPPSGFERLCQRLLREAGFAEVEVTGQSGDGGLDGNGLLQINPLVSLKVYFQCKRYKGSVPPSEVRDFRGAMQGRADKGIFLTTGTFTTDAKKEAVREGVSQIHLVDGEGLIDLFQQLDLGLRKTLEIDEAFLEPFSS